MLERAHGRAPRWLFCTVREKPVSLEGGLLMRRKGMQTGVLIISHGSPSEGWVELVDQATAQVHFDQERLAMDLPVESVFLELVEGRLIADGLRRLKQLGVTDIVVVPLFVSSGSTHVAEIRCALGTHPRVRIHFCRPIDDDPEIVQIIYEKVKKISRNPAKEALLLAGHGSAEPGFHERWEEGLTALSAEVKRLGGFAAADRAMLLPEQLRERAEAMTGKYPDWRLVVAPVFLSEGYFTKQVIPSRLEGLDYVYSGEALLPHPLISRWIARQVREAIGKIGASEESGPGAANRNPNSG